MVWISFVIGLFLGVSLGILILGWRRWCERRGDLDWIATYQQLPPFPTIANGEICEKSRWAPVGEKKLRPEARKHQRFRGNDETMAALYPSTADHSVLLGKILDMSRGGLALAYSAEKDKGRKGVALHLEILGMRSPFLRIENVPGKIVYDLETERGPESSSTARRCGVQFGELTGTQSSQLEDFIQNHMVCEV